MIQKMWAYSWVRRFLKEASWTKPLRTAYGVSIPSLLSLSVKRATGSSIQSGWLTGIAPTQAISAIALPLLCIEYTGRKGFQAIGKCDGNRDGFRKGVYKGIFLSSLPYLRGSGCIRRVPRPRSYASCLSDRRDISQHLLQQPEAAIPSRSRSGPRCPFLPCIRGGVYGTRLCCFYNFCCPTGRNVWFLRTCRAVREEETFGWTPGRLKS